MRTKTLASVTLALLLGLGSPVQGQEAPPEKPQDAQSSGGDAPPSPDEIIDQMSGQQSESAVEAERNPALLEDGEFEAGRDIFENIFNQKAQDAPMVDGLPGMRIEEVNLQGIMTGAFGTVALFLAKDKEIYTARVNQQFANGRLTSIQSDKVVFEQEVIDEFGKKRPPLIKEVQLHAENQMKGRGR